MSAPTATIHDANVDRGVELLDAKLGRNVWLRRVDLATLEVGSSDRCVACQATGTRWYSYALDALGVTTEFMTEFERPFGISWTHHHGFGLVHDNGELASERDFAGLDAAWQAKIKQLRFTARVE